MVWGLTSPKHYKYLNKAYESPASTFAMNDQLKGLFPSSALCFLGAGSASGISFTGLP